MTTKNNTSVGISGLASYMPPLRVQLEDWCQWTGNPWPKIRNVVGRSFRMAGPDESVYTMAATAVLHLIEQYDIDPQDVGFLGFGTESSTDNSAGPIIIKGMLDQRLAATGRPQLSRSCEVPEFKHACLGGVYAMKGALRYLALDGAGRKAIVVCADIAEYARGSSGEPTQGAGAVAMLLERDPKLMRVALGESGTASAYRTMDFRKPMLRLCSQDWAEGRRIQDFPVFNGKYSTTCYIDETLHALKDMCQKRKLQCLQYMRSLNYVFMHRPYKRMPETGLAYAYLSALAEDPENGHAELAGYADEAGVKLRDVIEELRLDSRVTYSLDQDQINREIFPLSSAVLHMFRNSPQFEREVIAKLALGADSNSEFGNLYTAALPAWLAAGLESALDSGLDIGGEEMLTMGYGSGDAAEIIPFYVVDEWRTATQKIRFSDSMKGGVDLRRDQYEALHDRLPVPDLANTASNAFVVDRIGSRNSRQFSDIGIEYHRFSGQPAIKHA